ncbi:NAD-dependent epimerase/dehydratase family protein [Aquirufa antheringensis]|uniref:NAD-dependent epimerase/dehydratase family protein n=1 Tax=Aquirufa antheringensis TaxID=2516559 RepID=UPI00208E72BA|nr:NAD-dependent epimerase/dehydratase family protein [Aquirufa antheringensis]USQ03332.1 NAD-dependent epimerase/dehydratase family protein [Aquirufa antheringensis]
MSSIFITGSTGFVGRNLISHFNTKYSIFPYLKNAPISINQDIVLHLAGKAHDLNNVSDPREYYEVNTELTKKVFDVFLESNARTFITLSSVKAVADVVYDELTEITEPNPKTHYGKSKLLAEQYILSKPIPKGKRVFILRPCMIHGPGNKGNLNLLYKVVTKLRVWPLGAFANKRSYCGVNNLLFVINELINNVEVSSGIYNVSDNNPLSSNQIIELISSSEGKRILILHIPQRIIRFISKLGTLLNFGFNERSLSKVTSNYIVSNEKLRIALKKELPYDVIQNMIYTLKSF